MLFYLASLQAIPTDVYEAAAIDGAGPWRTFWKMTFPLLKPGHFFVAVVSIIGAMKVFDQNYIVGGTSGGPNYSTKTIVLDIYNTAIKDAHFGLRRCRRARALRRHLRGHDRPAASVREARRWLDGRRAAPTTPDVARGRRARTGAAAVAAGRPTPQAFPAASGPSGSGAIWPMPR